MKMEIYQNNKLVNTINNQQAITQALIGYLWKKAIYKTGKHRYKYNYSDKQTLTLYYDNGFQYVIKNIPTEWGSLKEYDIIDALKTEILTEDKGGC